MSSNLNLPPWSPERIEALRALSLTRLSSGKIAAILNVTRCAVIGQCSRRGFPLSYQGTARDGGTTPDPHFEFDASPVPAPVPPKRRAARKAPPKPAPAPKPKPAPIPIVLPTDADMPLPTSRPCTLLELTGTSCRWPLGHPREPDFRFCGAEKEPEHSYCAPHRALAYRAPMTFVPSGPGRAMVHPGGASRILESEGGAA